MLERSLINGGARLVVHGTCWEQRLVGRVALRLGIALLWLKAHAM